MNPYLMPVPARGMDRICQARRVLEPLIATRMEGFGDALEGAIPKDIGKRVRAHTLLRIAGAAFEQARTVAIHHFLRAQPLLAADPAAMEATLGSSTLVAQIAPFITQMVHMSLDVYPRLLAPHLVSVQPFTQPSGYVFFLKYLAKNNGTVGAGSGVGAGRNLADKDTFDPNYGDLVNEGDQVKAVGAQIDKVLVEVKYKGLMHQFSLQSDVAMRAQYGFDLMQIGDMVTADELAWEVDREVIDAVLAFAATNPRGTIYWDPAPGAYAGWTPDVQKSYDKTFMSKAIVQAQVEMSGDVYEMPNWMICGSAIIQMLLGTRENWASLANNQADVTISRGAVVNVGVTTDGYKVWHDPQLDPNTAVMGFVQPNNPFYAGFVFSPFGTASTLTAAFQDPDTFLTKKARALAFAKVGIRPRQFRVIRMGTAS